MHRRTPANRSIMINRPSAPLRVAMLARVVFPLHGFGGIERHVFHLVTHLTRLGVRVTLYVQPPTNDGATGRRSDKATGRWDDWMTASQLDARSAARALSRSPVQPEVVFLRYDYTSPYLRP